MMAGNYLSEVWPTIKNFIKTDDHTGYYNYLFHECSLQALEDSPLFLLVDIHGFSKLCSRLERRGNIQEITHFLELFFFEMSKRIYREGVSTIKFIGDAILAIHSNRQTLLKLGNKLISIYHESFLPKYPRTNIVVLVTHPKTVIKGFACGQDYADYSYWGSGINNLFAQAKCVEEGHVWYIRRDGTPVKKDMEL